MLPGQHGWNLSGSSVLLTAGWSTSFSTPAAGDVLASNKAEAYRCYPGPVSTLQTVSECAAATCSLARTCRYSGNSPLCRQLSRRQDTLDSYVYPCIPSLRVWNLESRPGRHRATHLVESLSAGATARTSDPRGRSRPGSGAPPHPHPGSLPIHAREHTQHQAVRIIHI